MNSKDLITAALLYVATCTTALYVVLHQQKEITNLELELNKAEFVIEQMKDVYLKRNEL